MKTREKADRALDRIIYRRYKIENDLASIRREEKAAHAEFLAACQREKEQCEP